MWVNPISAPGDLAPSSGLYKHCMCMSRPTHMYIQCHMASIAVCRTSQGPSPQSGTIHLLFSVPGKPLPDTRDSSHSTQFSSEMSPPADLFWAPPQGSAPHTASCSSQLSWEERLTSPLRSCPLNEQREWGEADRGAEIGVGQGSGHSGPNGLGTHGSRRGRG